jgi:hypothetical protein
MRTVRAVAEVLNVETICKACEDMFVAAKSEATAYQRECGGHAHSHEHSLEHSRAASQSRSQNNSISEQSQHDKSANNTNSLTSALMATTETLGDEDEPSHSSSGPDHKEASSADSSEHEGRVVPYSASMNLSPADTLYLRQERVVFTVLNSFLRGIIDQISQKGTCATGSWF